MILADGQTEFEHVEPSAGDGFFSQVRDGGLVMFEDINDPDNGVDGIADEAGFAN